MPRVLAVVCILNCRLISRKPYNGNTIPAANLSAFVLQATPIFKIEIIKGRIPRFFLLENAHHWQNTHTAAGSWRAGLQALSTVSCPSRRAQKTRCMYRKAWRCQLVGIFRHRTASVSMFSSSSTETVPPKSVLALRFNIKKTKLYCVSRSHLLSRKANLQKRGLLFDRGPGRFKLGGCVYPFYDSLLRQFIALNGCT